jgi:mannose-1-phosphate guanylyltransferase
LNTIHYERDLMIQPMVWHPLTALTKVPGLTEVVLIGFYEDSVMAGFIKDSKREFPNITISYLREYRPLGTAGGLYHCELAEIFENHSS